MMKRINSLVLIICVFVSFCLVKDYSIAAQDFSDNEDETLITLAKEADMFVNLLWEDFTFVAENWEEGTELREFAIQKGYFQPETMREIIIDLDVFFGLKETAGMSNYKYYSFGENFNTIEKWKAEVLTYFQDGVLDLFHPYGNKPFYYNLIETEGKTWGYSMGNGAALSAYWDTATVQYSNGQTAVLEVRAYDNYLVEECKESFTVEFSQTEDGWRICGGTYFPEAYGKFIFPNSSPAQTGDASVFSVIAVSISVLALGAVVYRRKRTI